MDSTDQKIVDHDALTVRLLAWVIEICGADTAALATLSTNRPDQRREALHRVVQGILQPEGQAPVSPAPRDMDASVEYLKGVLPQGGAPPARQLLSDLANADGQDVGRDLIATATATTSAVPAITQVETADAFRSELEKPEQIEALDRLLTALIPGDAAPASPRARRFYESWAIYGDLTLLDNKEYLAGTRNSLPIVRLDALAALLESVLQAEVPEDSPNAQVAIATTRAHALPLVTSLRQDIAALRDGTSAFDRTWRTMGTMVAIAPPFIIAAFQKPRADIYLASAAGAYTSTVSSAMEAARNPAASPKIFDDAFIKRHFVWLIPFFTYFIPTFIPSQEKFADVEHHKVEAILWALLAGAVEMSVFLLVTNAYDLSRRARTMSGPDKALRQGSLKLPHGQPVPEDAPLEDIPRQLTQEVVTTLLKGMYESLDQIAENRTTFEADGGRITDSLSTQMSFLPKDVERIEQVLSKVMDHVEAAVAEDPAMTVDQKQRAMKISTTIVENSLSVFQTASVYKSPLTVVDVGVFSILSAKWSWTSALNKKVTLQDHSKLFRDLSGDRLVALPVNVINLIKPEWLANRYGFGVLTTYLCVMSLTVKGPVGEAAANAMLATIQAAANPRTTWGRASAWMAEKIEAGMALVKAERDAAELETESVQAPEDRDEQLYALDELAIPRTSFDDLAQEWQAPQTVAEARASAPAGERRARPVEDVVARPRTEKAVAPPGETGKANALGELDFKSDFDNLGQDWQVRQSEAGPSNATAITPPPESKVQPDEAHKADGRGKPRP
jgi:hypothetical protein